MVARREHPEVANVTVSSPVQRADQTWRLVVTFERPRVYRARVELEISTHQRDGSSVIVAMRVRSLRPWRTPLGQEILKTIPQTARDLAFLALRDRPEPERDLALPALIAYRAVGKDSKGPASRTDILSFAEAASEVAGGKITGKSQPEVRALLKASTRPEFQYGDRTLSRRIEKALRLGLLDEALRATAKLRAELKARTDNGR